MNFLNCVQVVWWVVCTCGLTVLTASKGPCHIGGYPVPEKFDLRADEGF